MDNSIENRAALRRARFENSKTHNEFQQNRSDQFIMSRRTQRRTQLDQRQIFETGYDIQKFSDVQMDFNDLLKNLLAAGEGIEPLKNIVVLRRCLSLSSCVIPDDAISNIAKAKSSLVPILHTYGSTSAIMTIFMRNYLLSDLLSQNCLWTLYFLMGDINEYQIHGYQQHLFGNEESQSLAVLKDMMMAKPGKYNIINVIVRGLRSLSAQVMYQALWLISNIVIADEECIIYGVFQEVSKGKWVERNIFGEQEEKQKEKEIGEETEIQKKERIEKEMQQLWLNMIEKKQMAQMLAQSKEEDILKEEMIQLQKDGEFQAAIENAAFINLAHIDHKFQFQSEIDRILAYQYVILDAKDMLQVKPQFENKKELEKEKENDIRQQNEEGIEIDVDDEDEDSHYEEKEEQENELVDNKDENIEKEDQSLFTKVKEEALIFIRTFLSLGSEAAERIRAFHSELLDRLIWAGKCLLLFANTNLNNLNLLIEKNVLPIFISMHNSVSTQLRRQSLMMIECVLTIHPNGKVLIEENGGITAMEYLKYNKFDISQLAENILLKYFENEDDVEFENEQENGGANNSAKNDMIID
ncbi:MAG: hypothetical protein EZS28_000660 [Streblomastix strix]|uniref:Uncharacterized protein n=1 Tax=Streblomastix strix TaxID=222440 RepID=A0A5J4X9Q5_9EUKA|nr:MAG: hypothetical protein EZS28_000660 [Streblomastix strix]